MGSEYRGVARACCGECPAHEVTVRVMSRQNAAIVAAIHRLWNAREPTRDLIDEDLEYVNPPRAMHAGLHRSTEPHGNRRLLPACRQGAARAGRGNHLPGRSRSKRRFRRPSLSAGVTVCP